MQDLIRRLQPSSFEDLIALVALFRPGPLQSGMVDDFINRRIEVVKDFYPTIDDWELHLTTIFPEARLKKFIEMRGADAGNINHVCALSAFWVGLMYDDNSLDAAIELTKNISPQELVELRNIVPSKGLNSKLDKLDLYQLASEVISISKDGLKSASALA